MNRVTFVPIARSAEARSDETILDVARRAGAPLGNSCGGVGTCLRCRVLVVEGEGHLTPRTSAETAHPLETSERLACQAVVLGDCAVTTSYW